MPGVIFDWEQPHPSVVVEAIRQAVRQAVADVLANSGAVDQLIVDALTVQLRDDGQDDAIDLLILDSLQAAAPEEGPTP